MSVYFGVAAAWIGHSEAVSRKHYLMVTEGDFKRATLPDTADKNGKNDAEGALQTGAAEPARIDANQDEPSPDDAID